MANAIFLPNQGLFYQIYTQVAVTMLWKSLKSGFSNASYSYNEIENKLCISFSTRLYSEIQFLLSISLLKVSVHFIGWFVFLIPNIVNLNLPTFLKKLRRIKVFFWTEYLSSRTNFPLEFPLSRYSCEGLKSWPCG